MYNIHVYIRTFIYIFFSWTLVKILIIAVEISEVFTSDQTLPKQILVCGAWYMKLYVHVHIISACIIGYVYYIYTIIRYLLVTMMTSSATFDISLMAMYTSRRRGTSLDWNSFVMEKNVSVASVEFMVVPWVRWTYVHAHTCVHVCINIHVYISTYRRVAQEHIVAIVGGIEIILSPFLNSQSVGNSYRIPFKKTQQFCLFKHCWIWVQCPVTFAITEMQNFQT